MRASPAALDADGLATLILEGSLARKVGITKSRQKQLADELITNACLARTAHKRSFTKSGHMSAFAPKRTRHSRELGGSIAGPRERNSASLKERRMALYFSRLSCRSASA